MDVPGGVLCIESHGLQKLLHPGLLLFPALAHMMGLQPLGNDVSHLHLGVKGGIGVLENDLDLLRKLLPFLSPEAVDILSLIKDMSVGPAQNADAGTAAGGLSAARLADDPQSLSPADKKRNVINGL